MVFSNDIKKFSVVLKSSDRQLKNQSNNVVNRIKNGNPSRSLIAPIGRKQPPPQINDIGMFSCFNYEKPDHTTKRCRSKPKSGATPNA